MLEKMLVLLERFVVAHEKLAEAAEVSAKAIQGVNAVAADIKVETEAAEPEQKAPAKRTRAAKPKATPEPEQEPEEEEEAPAPKTRREQMATASEASKAKAKAKSEPDLGTLREEIKTMATHIAEGDSDECADEFDDLLEDFKVRTVTKLNDDDVEEFHAEAKKIVSKYYELED